MTELHLIFMIYPSVVDIVDLVSSIMENGSAIVKLKLTATSEVNGTNVTCHEPNGAMTEPAYLCVQGQYNTFIYSKYYYFLPDGQ